jgi:hypothetical protein
MGENWGRVGEEAAMIYEGDLAFSGTCFVVGGAGLSKEAGAARAGGRRLIS